MKVRFLGVMKNRRIGCSTCAKRAASRTSFSTSASYMLPSGRRMTFYVGRVAEVSDRDGKWLLSYVTADANGTRKVFEEVK